MSDRQFKRGEVWLANLNPTQGSEQEAWRLKPQLHRQNLPPQVEKPNFWQIQPYSQISPRRRTLFV